MDIAALHGYIFDADRLLPSVLGCFLALMLGASPFFRAFGLPFIWHISRPFFKAINNKLDRPDRGQRILKRRGQFIFVFWFLVGLSIGYLLQETTPLKFKASLQILAVASCVLPAGLWLQTIGLTKGFRSQSMPQGIIYSLSKSSGLAIGAQDDPSIMRLTLTSFVRLIDKALVSPVLWFLIGGLPFLFAASIAQGAVWHSGRDGKTSFGEGLYQFEKYIGVVPTWITGFFVFCAAFIAPKASIARALLSKILKGEQASYEEGGVAVTNLAYTLGVALGGPVTDTQGISRTLRWVGPVAGSARINVTIFAQGVYLLALVAALWCATLLGAAVWA